MAEAAIETSALAHFQITRRKAMKVNRKGAERQLVVHRPASSKLSVKGTITARATDQLLRRHLVW